MICMHKRTLMEWKRGKKKRDNDISTSNTVRIFRHLGVS
jgi:hypothetical protein